MLDLLGCVPHLPCVKFPDPIAHNAIDRVVRDSQLSALAGVAGCLFGEIIGLVFFMKTVVPADGFRRLHQLVGEGWMDAQLS